MRGLRPDSQSSEGSTPEAEIKEGEARARTPSDQRVMTERKGALSPKDARAPATSSDSRHREHLNKLGEIKLRFLEVPPFERSKE